MKFFRALCLGLFAFASTIATASAQAVISGNYYEENKTANCGSSNPCSVVFSAAPQNVFITDVSCVIDASGTNPISNVMLGVSDSANGTVTPRRPEYFIPVSLVATATATVWAVRSKAGFLFGTGRWPDIVVTTFGAETGMSFTCKISGTFVVP